MQKLQYLTISECTSRNIPTLDNYSILFTRLIFALFSKIYRKITFYKSSRFLRSQRSEDADSIKEDSVGSSNSVRHKIVVLGAAKVGKSSLINQFLYGTFSPKYKRTVEEMHHGDFNVGGVHLTLDILDTSGAYEFPAMRALSISSADAFILVYDVTDAETFEEVRALRDQIHETKNGTAVPIVVVGNKTDLSGDRQVRLNITIQF